ncbi:MAG TPA: DUF6263 family protein [Candidatus Acidoferrales bacterium]|nr:DUF6263 family protein [Candidatus Acidoferrales bacterium]
MKKSILLITSLLALSLPFCGCNKSGKLNQKSEFKPPSGPMEFKLKWPQGERVEQDIDMKMKSDITVPGQPTPLHQDMTLDMAYAMTVLQANSDGTHEIELEFLSSRMQVMMGGRTNLDYDSAKPAMTREAKAVGDIFGKIIGSKVQYYLNATNGVDRIEGVDGLMTRLATGASPQDLAPLKSTFSEGFFKQLMSANLLLPQKPVEPGDTWSVRLEFPMAMMGTMVINQDFTFDQWEMHGKRSCARLSYQGTITSKDNPAPVTGQMSMAIHDGTTSGTSWFDPELGITIDTAAVQNFKMTMEVPNPAARGQAPKMLKVETDMQQDMTVKLGSVK